MKKIIPLFLIAMIGFAPTLAQNSTSNEPVSLDKKSYKYDEIIKITGKVSSNITPDTRVELAIFNPSGYFVIIDYVDVNPDKTYKAEFKTDGPEWYFSGVYTVQASYRLWEGDSSNIATTTFTYTADPSLSKINIQVKTAKSSYSYGETILATIQVNEVLSVPASLRVIAPNGYIVTIEQIYIDSDKISSVEITAGGNLWKAAGTYTIEASYGLTAQNTATATTTFEVTYGEALTCGINQELVNGKCIDKQPSIAKNDTVPPLILIPSDMTVDASNSQGATVSYSVKVIDNVDGILHAKCTPFSGSQFQIGENLVTCTASDFSGNLAKKSFKVIVRSPSLSIPVWIKDVATFWCKDEIDNASFIEAIQYLIDNEVIKVPLTKSSSSGSQAIPKWIKNTACWWSQGSISDNDFASGLQYLVANGIIKV